MTRDATDGASTDTDGASTDAEALLALPPDRRAALEEPFGPVETDARTLLERVGDPLIAVGDVVTYHFQEVGRTPDVSVVDGHTKRRAVDDEIRESVATDPAIEVTNPPAAITGALVRALLEALDRDEPTTIRVEGEEDLATLPAILAAPDGASVVYGQPDEGMVHVRVAADRRAEIRALLEGFDGDHDRLWALLD